MSYLGNDSDNVLTGDFTGDFRSGFGESHKLKVKRTDEKRQKKYWQAIHAHRRTQNNV